MKYRYALYMVTTAALAISFAFAGMFIMQTSPHSYGILGFIIGMATSVGSFISWIENKIENRILGSLSVERKVAESSAEQKLREIKDELEELKTKLPKTE